MRLDLSTFTTSLLLLTTLATTASAQQTSTETETRAEPLASWSIGAGVGFSGYGFGYGSAYTFGLANINGVVRTPSPSGQLAAELRLSDRLALTAQANAGYSQNESTNSTWDTDHGWLGLRLGLRWILNPGGAVEISPTASLEGAWLWSTDRVNGGLGEDWNFRSESYGYLVGLVVGLALERELIDNLFLRIESSLLQCSYVWGEATAELEDGGTGNNHTNSFFAGLAFNPSIQLRLAF